MSKSKTNAEITRVTYRWDDQPGVEPGWYCMTYDTDGFRDDSMKVWFPFNVEDYDQDEENELVATLREEFPNAEIIAQG